MALNHFTYNGKSTADFGLLVNGLSTYGAPARKVEKISVPGRNGDILIDDGTYDNYIARYEISIVDNVKANARDIVNWLLSAKGYNQLSDTYNPESYRMATCYSNIAYVMTNLIDAGTATIEFDCRPQRYLTTGDTEVTLTVNSSNSITNSTLMIAKPIITVKTKSTGSRTITTNGSTFTLSHNALTDTVIDCENMTSLSTATPPTVVSVSGDFPELQPGANTIVLGDGFSTAKIKPKWWVL